MRLISKNVREFKNDYGNIEVIKQIEGKEMERYAKRKRSYISSWTNFISCYVYLTSDANDKFPSFKKEFCDGILQHKPNFILKEFKNWRKEDDNYLRTFIPLYCEIANYLKRSKIPTYGVVERSVNKAPGTVSKAMIGELYGTRVRKIQLEKRNFDNSWKVKKAGHAAKGDEIEKVFKSYVLGDPYLFDLILDEGEYIQPIQVLKQNPFKWPNFSSKGYFEKF